MNQISIYDEVSFPSYPHAASHPQRLATIARSRGFNTAPVDACRVLELGCGAGGNLLPLADTLPESQFLGIDLSEQQIAIAREHAAAAELKNIELRVADILDLDTAIGPFDYILCHGVFSWTTDACRSKILALFRDLLSDRGVAYLNYNTYPGWHLQGMLRDMLRFHTRRFQDPQTCVREARKLIDFLLQTLPSQQSAAGALLHNEIETLKKYSDPYLFHAYLNVVNQPFYIHQVIQIAEASELQYLGDAEPQTMWPGIVSPAIESQILDLTRGEDFHLPVPEGVSTTVDNEQYHDFVRFTMSRRSLFCRKEILLQFAPVFPAEDDLHLSAQIQSRPLPASAPSNAACFGTAGRVVTVVEPRLQSTLHLLAEAWPESRPWKWLGSEVEKRLGATGLAGAVSLDQWRQDLFHCFAAGILELSVIANPCVRSIAEMPRATPLARRQALTQEFVTNLRHAAVPLNHFDRFVLHNLDGTRNQLEIVIAIQQSRPESACSQQMVQQSLDRLAGKALLQSVAGTLRVP